MNDPQIIIALDFDDVEHALALVDRMDPQRCRLKIGKQLFSRAGPSIVERLVTAGFDVFLDLKYHDIPNTVAGACRAAADLGVWMVNVHAQGGRRMMEAAGKALAAVSQPPLLIAVTILTSLGEEDIRETGLSGSPMENVLRLAQLASEAGMDGVVCSPREIEVLRRQFPPAFKLVTPGIRPVGAQTGDQKRVLTPAEALSLGATYLVIGRPITAADDPMAALAAIEGEIGLQGRR